MSLAYWAELAQSNGETPMTMPQLTSRIRLFAAFFAVFAACATGAHASTIYLVTMDTSALVGNPSAPFYLDFQFIDGSGPGDSNNTVTITDFSVAGVGAATATNGGSGDLGSSIRLIDSALLHKVS